MIKRNMMEEIENTLLIVKEEIDKAKANGNYKQALEYINKQLKGMVGIDIDTINTISFSSVVDMISRDNGYNDEVYIALGSLLRYQGYIYQNIGDKNLMFLYYTKSLQAFNQGLKKDNTVEGTYTDDMQAVLNEFGRYEITVDEGKIILKSYELLNRFDKAEDTLYYLMNKYNKSDEVVLLGIDFYDRLKGIPEEELEKGNLPISEVNEALEELENLG